MNNLETASIADRLAALGSERWALHFETRRRIKAGEDIIELTIGEPDIPTPTHLIDVADAAMRNGRTRYSGGKGEPAMLAAVAKKYAARSGRDITEKNVLAVPGTQAALSLAAMTLVETGDAMLVPDPYYATYEGVVRATGAEFVPIPMDAGNGFHLSADQLEAAVTPNAKVLLLNSPHNPTGAVLSDDEITAIARVCKKHNLWILSDEVYEQLIYRGSFASAFDQPEFADRVITVSSISKSHAAPGFRSGWCVGPDWFIDRMQSVAEAMLFGGQPFIADMTTHALSTTDDTASRMATAYQRRIKLLIEMLSSAPGLNILEPDAGMFMLIDVSKSGLDGDAFARRLLDYGVGIMPGNAFGEQAKNFIRLSLTVSDEVAGRAAQRILDFTHSV